MGPCYQNGDTKWNMTSGRSCGSAPQGHRGPTVRLTWARDSLVNTVLTKDRGLEQGREEWYQVAQLEDQRGHVYPGKTLTTPGQRGSRL